MALKQLSTNDFNNTELLNAKVHLLASDPGSPADGLIWINTTTNVLKFRTGGVTYSLGRLDQLNVAGGNVNINGNKITNAADGSAASDYATFGQLSAVIAGLDFKGSVRAATTTNGALATAYENGDAIDGVTLATGNRILLKNQTSAAENGIYTVNASGAPTRATDFDSSAEASPGALIPVEEGTVNGDSLWLHTTNGPITLDTTSLTFQRIGLSSGTSKHSLTGPASSSTTFAHAHNLNTQDVQAQLQDASTRAMVEAEWVATDANTVTWTFAVAQAQDSVRSIVIG